MNLLLVGFTVVLFLSYSFSILNSQVFKTDIPEFFIERAGIQSALAQQDNSTTDDETTDDETTDDETTDDETTDDETTDDETTDDETTDDETTDDENMFPKADDKNVEMNQDESFDIQLTGTDEDGDEVTFYIKRFPDHGSLNGVDEDTGYVTGDDNVATYDPEDGFVGEDSFSVRPFDGRSSGQIGYISIKVNHDTDSPSSGQLPIANAGSEQTVHSSEEVQLDGTGSYDPDCINSLIDESPHCGNLSYEWELQNDGLTIEGLDSSALSEDKLTFTAPTVEDTETVSFQLIVSDGIDGSSDPSTVDITVEPPEGNSMDSGHPIADAGQDQIVSREKSVQLDGTGSYDPDGDAIWPVSWKQTAGDPVVLSGTDTLEPTFNTPLAENDKILSFELIVSDGFYNSDPSTVDVTITPPSVGTEYEDPNIDTTSSTPVGTEAEDPTAIEAAIGQSTAGNEEGEYNWDTVLLLSGVVVALIGVVSMIKKLTHHHLVEVRTRGKIEYY